jgi:hypothetical protein
MMKNLLSCTCAALLTFAAASPCFAADSPWSGTWKENLAKDKLTGETIVITAKGSGYHFTNGPVSYDFSCDGKPYTTFAKNTITCTSTSDGGLDFTTTANGKVTSKSHRSFSPDGKQMTMNSTEYREDGTTTNNVIVRNRKSGTKGIVGEWVNAKVTPSEPEVMTIKVDNDMFHMQGQHAKTSIDAKLDGTDTKVVGPMVPAGAIASYKSLGAHKLQYSFKLNGKVMDEGTLTLSPDGKTLTDTSWAPGKENEKTSEVYDKQ